jgi:hypothetical protein
MSDPSVPTPAQVEAIWGRERSLRAQLCVSVDEIYARALTLTRRWFEDGFDLLGGAFRDAASTLAPADLDVNARISGRRPGAVSIQLQTRLSGKEPPAVPCPYSREAWEDLLLTLGRVPDWAWMECAANDSEGDTDGPYVEFVADRIDSAGTWWLLSTKGSPDMLLAEPGRSALLEFLRGVADRANPAHGEVSWGNALDQCVYEAATASRPVQTLPKARWALRGYAWVTIMPEEIGVRLGGLEALRGSGAFVEVEHLGVGGFWCRATEAPEQFDQAAAERVFDVVAPVLPPGRPNMWAVRPPNVLSSRDPLEAP